MAMLPWVAPPPGPDPIWYPLQPNHGQYSPQMTALESNAQMLLFGGASGGGKSDFLVADAIQEVDNPNLRGLLLRKSFSEMQQLVDRMGDIYKPLGGHPTDGGLRWRFPSGAKIRLGYMSSDADIEKYQGNPYTWLGVDEAGNQAESRIRRIMPWLASTDPTLRVRARFSANPGGIGAEWLMRVFLRSHCPVHFSNLSVEPGQVYGGPRVTWSDGVPIGMTVAFVPSKVEDNPLYGEAKVNALRMQEASVAEHLLLGCWCDLEGAYFPFLASQPKITMNEVQPKWWWTHAISIDYGYGQSAAAAGLYAVSEEGTKYKVDEMVEKRMGSIEFAETIAERWLTAAEGSQRRRVVCAYIDPANDSHTDVGLSNMQQMAAVFERYDVPLLKASKDRIANAQRLYNGLRTRELIICHDTCPQTYRSLTTRMHDDRLGDVKKIHGDPLDDSYDETSYYWNSWNLETEKPETVRNEETLHRYRDAGMDEHSLNVYQLKMAMAGQQQGRSQPMRLGGGRRRR